jgi:hypothetical protein
MQVRAMIVQLFEWRALRLADPVERLQFLRTKLPGAAPRRAQVLLRAPAITLLLALVSSALLQSFARRAWSPRSAAPASPVAKPRLVLNPGELNTGGLKTAEPAFEARAVPKVWLVDANPHFDLYSNGLRVENQFATSSEPRKYLAFPREKLDQQRGEWRSEPAGIVFHTTESHLAPFEEDQNRTLKRTGEGLLEYVSRRRSYHFLIDRFGRVFRIVRESDYANHAGNSIWADEKWVYVYLNRSFFGVAFEAQSAADSAPSNPAQIHAARILTEMLRALYAIPADNCVTHAQVSVNPDNLRAGYHTDWPGNLPFRDLGLSDNYRHPLPSVMLFGFAPDSLLAEAAGSPLEQGLLASESRVQQEAAARGIAVDRYRQRLQKRYRDTITALASKGAVQEKN